MGRINEGGHSDSRLWYYESGVFYHMISEYLGKWNKLNFVYTIEKLLVAERHV